MKKTYEWSTITVPGQTRIIKPSSIPDISDDADVEVYVDGRKVFKGEGRQYLIECEGLLIQLGIQEDHEVGVRYTQ